MVKLIYRKKVWEVKPGMTVRDAILKTGLKPYAVLAVRDGDEIKLVAVVSGG